jgi:hypothetical protein
MKSCLLNTVCMLLPYLCLQCCSPVGPNGKDSAQQVQRGIHKTDDLKSYNTQQLTAVSQCQCMRHTWGRQDMHTGFWWGNLKDAT